MVTRGAIRHAKLQSNRHHQQTNTELFTGRMTLLSPSEQYQSTEEETNKQLALLILSFKFLILSASIP